jgi:hypothetical protein
VRPGNLGHSLKARSGNSVSCHICLVSAERHCGSGESVLILLGTTLVLRLVAHVGASEAAELE